MTRPTFGGYLRAAVFFLLVWQLGAWAAGETILPGPALTMSALGKAAGTKIYWMHVAVSTFRILASIAAAFVTAVPVGLALGASRRAYAFSAPFIYLIHPIPKIVFLPLILLAFGLGDLSKIFLIGLIVFFQLLITTRDAARQITTEMRYSMKSLGAGRWDFFWHVVWPVSLPGIFTSLRVGAGTAVAVLFFVESIGTQYGLGLYILNAWGMADGPTMFVGIVSLSALGVLIYELFDILEKRFCGWKDL